MLTVETIGRIRREHFIKGKTIREIARDLRVSRNTVRKVLRSGETSFEYDRENNDALGKHLQSNRPDRNRIRRNVRDEDTAQVDRALPDKSFA